MAVNMYKKKDDEETKARELEQRQLYKNNQPTFGSQASPIKYNAPNTSTKGASLVGESPYKIPPSNNDIYPNTNYMKNMLDAESRGDFNSAAYWERMRNEKINNGLGGNYAPTSMYNYNSKYADKISDLRGQLENYEDFSYNPLKDAAYRSLANVYDKNARDASANALGQIAAASGGRTNSNAVIASDLAYQNKMAGLEAEIPGLRQLAYDMYNREKSDLRDTMVDYMAQEQQDYGRWENDLNRRIENQRYQNEMDYQRGRDAIEDERYLEGVAYQKERDAIEDERHLEGVAYQKERDAVEDKRYQEELDATTRLAIAQLLNDATYYKGIGNNELISYLKNKLGI